MHRIGKVILLLACVTAAFAQAPEPPLADTRFTIHTSSAKTSSRAS